MNETLGVGEEGSLWMEHLQVPSLTIENLLFAFKLDT